MVTVAAVMAATAALDQDSQRNINDMMIAEFEDDAIRLAEYRRDCRARLLRSGSQLYNAADMELLAWTAEDLSTSVQVLC
ncbi:hypothetical protein [Cupriavidus campinensis]